MAEINPIILHTRKGTPLRVLRPSEYDLIRNKVDNEVTRLIMDLSLYTGMRYIEMCRVVENPDWIREQSRTIYLSNEAQLKEQRKSPDRFVHLSREGWSAVSLFFMRVKAPKAELYSRRGFTKMLKTHAKEAGVSPEGLSAKTFRKTYESWLVQALVIQGRQPSALSLIAKSFGHTETTAISHYINLDFTKEDIDKILVRTAGWMGNEAP
jgi:integrase